MNYEIVELNEKIVAGVKAVTSNQDPKMGEIIGKLWKDFYGGEVQKLQNRANAKTIGLYCDYGTPNKEDYTVFVGAEVSEKNQSVETKIIPAGKYAKFEIKGDFVKAVGDCWTKIWQLPLERIFTADFEEYQEDSVNGEGTIIIYIAIK